VPQADDFSSVELSGYFVVIYQGRNFSTTQPVYETNSSQPVIFMSTDLKSPSLSYLSVTWSKYCDKNAFRVRRRSSVICYL